MKSFKLKYKNFLFQKFSRVVYVSTYINLDIYVIYICQNIHWTDIHMYLLNMKSFKLKYFCSLSFFQGSSMFLYNSWISTILFYICQNINFTDMLIMNIKSLNFFVLSYLYYIFTYLYSYGRFVLVVSLD